MRLELVSNWPSERSEGTHWEPCELGLVHNKGDEGDTSNGDHGDNVGASPGLGRAVGEGERKEEEGPSSGEEEQAEQVEVGERRVGTGEEGAGIALLDLGLRVVVGSDETESLGLGRKEFVSACEGCKKQRTYLALSPGEGEDDGSRGDGDDDREPVAEGQRLTQDDAATKLACRSPTAILLRR